MPGVDILEKKHATLVAEFDRYVVEHPEFAKKSQRTLRLFCKFMEMMNITTGVYN